MTPEQIELLRKELDYFKSALLDVETRHRDLKKRYAVCHSLLTWAFRNLQRPQDREQQDAGYTLRYEHAKTLTKSE